MYLTILHPSYVTLSHVTNKVPFLTIFCFCSYKLFIPLISGHCCNWNCFLCRYEKSQMLLQHTCSDANCTIYQKVPFVETHYFCGYDLIPDVYLFCLLFLDNIDQVRTSIIIECKQAEC
jgi:hypothetical protein